MTERGAEGGATGGIAFAGGPARPHSLRQWVHRQLDPTAWPRTGLSPVNAAVAVIIVAATFVAILETEPVVYQGQERLFAGFEIFFGIAFALEYLARLWSVVERPGAGPPLRARLRFIVTPASLFDIVAIAATLIPVAGSSGALLRLVRLLRIVRLARLGHLSAAIRTLSEAVSSRRFELTAAAGAALLLILFGATALYLVEGAVQPDQFGSIPRSIWWAVVTLTTIGYGDAYPVTALGRIFAGLVAIAGIGIIAMPTGILASAFTDACQRDRERKAAALAAALKDRPPAP
jgi:voltage-gated potassium channel